MRLYRLHPSAHVRVTSQGSVFLDLKRDAYVGIDAEQSAALAAVVEGWPQEKGSQVSKDEALLFAESLRHHGLLTQELEGHTALQPDQPAPIEELIAWRDMRVINLRAHHVFSFFRALCVAFFMLRVRSLLATVARAERRSAKREAPSSFPLDRARELLSIYTHIRAFVFSRRGRCLLDSVTLMEFLSVYGVCPRWVLGVQIRPFAAHSWVQYYDRVLNGTVGFVRTYSPIFVV